MNNFHKLIGPDAPERRRIEKNLGKKPWRTQLLTGSFLMLGLSCLESGAQQEKRYLVGFHSPNVFSELESSLEGFQRELATYGQHQRGLWGHQPQAPRVLSTEARLVQTLDLLNLAVIEASSELDVSELRQHPQVRFVEEEFFIPSPAPLAVPTRFSDAKRKTKNTETELTWGLKAIKAPEAWMRTESLMGVTQIGRSEVKVAVLDTGIDYNHPELKSRFLAGKNFVKSTLNITNIFSQTLLESLNQAQDSNGERDYFDTNGHGTHCAGTIAAEMDGAGVVGVAPRSRILMGRVCGKFGCSSVGIVEGINWAVKNGAQVLSMSLGGPLKSRAQDEALQRAEEAGVVNIAASGNDGTGKVSFPAAYESVLAVGAMDPAIKRADFSQWGPELDVIAPGVAVNSSVPVGSGRESKVYVTLDKKLQRVKSTGFVGAQDQAEPLVGDLVFAGLGKPEDFAGKDFQEKIALIARGEIAFAEKVKNAIAAKARAVLIFNNVDGLISGSLTQDGSLVPISVAMIEKSVGEKLRDALLGGNSLIQASVSTEPTNYAEFNGTSMATPHVAGVAALIVAANPKLKPEEVKNLIKTTTAKVSTCDDSKNECGTGLVNADAAVLEALKLRAFRKGHISVGLNRTSLDP